MKTLYLDLGMGAAGDMLTAALLELVPDPDAFVAKLNAAGLPGVRFERSATERCGIQGTHVSVKVHGTEESSKDGSSHHHHHHDHDHDHSHKHKKKKKSLFSFFSKKKDSKHEHHHHHHHRHRHHHHRSLAEVEQIIRSEQGVSDAVKETAIAVYARIAAAESHAHGVPVTEVHFHEVGTMDAIADVTAVCALMEAIAPDEVIASPVHVGSGFVQCAHGILSVPTPATAFLLKGVPMYSDGLQGELCTPTGAALITQFVTKFSSLPPMTVAAVGHGMGSKTFERANCLRAMLGDTEGVAENIEGFTHSVFDYDVTAPASEPEEPGEPDIAETPAAAKPAHRVDRSGDAADEEVAELSCNVDDMTGEAIGFATERLLDAGALDVYTEAIGMKKSRPGTCIRVLCRLADRDAIAQCLFRHTTTLGVREQRLRRYVLDRQTESVKTGLGTVHRKTATGYGVSRGKWEYEDVAELARKNGKSLAEIEETLKSDRKP